ncbi:MAG: endonuclease MutS2 [Pseudobutyrivibrio sp.]|nr:endonuclease MutS2 [Pseudobutyrivibrio sp.]
MNLKDLKTLEYDKIVARLSEKATCEAGRLRCQQLLPINDIEEIKVMQSETASAFNRLIKVGDVSASGTTDLRPSLARLELGSSLTIEEILAVANVLEVTKRVSAYGKQLEGEDALSFYFNGLSPEVAILNEIRRCIIDEETIADDASTALFDIRKGMQRTNDKIKSVMNSLLNNSTTRGYLQEPVVTMRQGRYCLPVRSDYKSRVPGMVHDQSSTGSTFFIEPMQAVDLNNEMRELQVREQDEIERILATISNRIAEASEGIIRNFELLTEIDFNLAKGRYAVELNACSPEFNEDGIINLRGARHPLLDPKKVVATDIKLGDDYNLLLVTGPNTGGKTVSLKTCGLLTLMAQAGLHIPVKDRSQVAVFDDVYADIGDEQSIEQSLSTFSSHMVNIVHILEAINGGSYSHETEELIAKNKKDLKHSKVLYGSKAEVKVPQFLILIDELCAGTDPKEGAALAQSILDRLHTLDVRTMATTHYSELKVYALSTEGVENASCEFSLETLSPTYRLIIGVPGKSNAFAISTKLGIPCELIDGAKSRLSENDKSFEDLMVDLEQKRHEVEENARKAASDLAAAEQKLADATAREEKIKSQREELIRQAHEDAAAILQEAKDIADETIRDFNKFGKGAGNISAMEAKRAALGKNINKNKSKAKEEKKVEENHNVPTNLHVGDKVKVLSMNLTGQVCTAPNAKGDVTVQMGIMKSTVNIKDLVLIEEEDKFVPKKGTRVKNMTYGGFNKAASISPEINLLGCTVDEGIAKLEKYLDDAYISHLTSVRVVHGKGTGALRAGVHQYLKKCKNVSDFHLGEFGEGDAGVTIVTFK